MISLLYPLLPGCSPGRAMARLNSRRRAYASAEAGGTNLRNGLARDRLYAGAPTTGRSYPFETIWLLLLFRFFEYVAYPRRRSTARTTRANLEQALSRNGKSLQRTSRSLLENVIPTRRDFGEPVQGFGHQGRSLVAVNCAARCGQSKILETTRQAWVMKSRGGLSYSLNRTK